MDGTGTNDKKTKFFGEILIMLWEHYVFRRGTEVHDMWDALFENREINLLYIAGRGFDIRAQSVINAFVSNLGNQKINKAELLLVSFTGYQLSSELMIQTDENARILEQTFNTIGTTRNFSIDSSASGEDDISASNALRIGTESILQQVTNQTDIIIDISSLPRVVYLALMTGLLQKLIPDKNAPHALFAKGVNLQILVAEDAALDGQIRAVDPSQDIVLIPGFSSVLHAESSINWPLVWFPILGENRINQLERILATALIPESAEICPVLPHPSRDPRRADKLLIEYRSPLFDKRKSPIDNILYVNESHPFEVYRQLFSAMKRYCDSMRILGGCRLVVTPLSSKLITLGAGLACFEMRPSDIITNYGVAIPYAEPTRYVASIEALRSSTPEIATMVLTGSAYEENQV
jgi:hypothetical protein